MATLVLSTVGTVLGGPVGGAIGALIGQSFDQQLLAPPSRGPRLGDLSVQTSSYGTEIPRVYGSMRVAGSVVWATDLVESDQTSGAKGQPDVTYSYSVSLAVALSSRPAGAIGRIWADGKLLRGAAGDFKVPVTFRFYDGSESQVIDPLIGSIEGIANTPAYRGIALAVFENLELAAFGNRIPFMTFELIADAEAPTIPAILGDASDGAIICDAADTVTGYAAYGRSIAAAVQPLVDCFDVALFDDGSVLRSPSDASAVAIASDELGNSAHGEKATKVQREQLPVRSVPGTLRLSYSDPARDYQTGEARAIAGEQSGNELQQELPAVLSADDAKTLVQRMLARQWSAREKLTLRLPPSRIDLEPGSIVEPGVAPGSWIIEKSTIDGFVAIVELRPSWQPTVALAGEAGRVGPNDDIVEGATALALVDAAAISDSVADPTVMVGASSPSPGWRAKPIEASYGGQLIAAETARRKAVIGVTDNQLAPADPTVVDSTSLLDVTLVDPDQWLVSCDDAALDEGANLAMVGQELLQFGQADPTAPGQFRLSRMRRGLRGTESAVGGHSVGETFLLIELDALKPLTLPPWAAGYEVSVVCGEASAAIVMPSKPVPAAIADPSGGTTTDAEARTAIDQILAALRQQGLIAS